MVLRLVLVSIVAGLGVPPPAENELAGWARSVQTWLDVQLVEWNVRGPLQVEASAPIAAPPTPDFDFDLTEDDLTALFAVEPAPASPAPSKDTNALAELAVEPQDDEWIALFGVEPGPEAPVLSKDTTDAAAQTFEAVVEEMVAEFSRDEAAALAQAAKTPAPQDDAVSEEADELEGELAEATNPRGESVMAAAIDEPLDLADDLFPVLAYELQHAAEVIVEPARVDVVSDAPVGSALAGNQLSNAVRLTRDAVYAWMNLIQSPAIVSISH